MIKSWEAFFLFFFYSPHLSPRTNLRTGLKKANLGQKDRNMPDAHLSTPHGCLRLRLEGKVHTHHHRTFYFKKWTIKNSHQTLIHQSQVFELIFELKASFCVQWAEGEHGREKKPWDNVITETRYFKNMAYGCCPLWQKKRAVKSDWLQAIITGEGRLTLPVCLQGVSTWKLIEVSLKSLYL